LAVVITVELDQRAVGVVVGEADGAPEIRFPYGLPH